MSAAADAYLARLAERDRHPEDSPEWAAADEDLDRLWYACTPAEQDEVRERIPD